MTTTSPVVSDENLPAATTATPRVRARLKLPLSFANFGVMTVWGSVPGMLLALQLQDIDAAHKEANLATVGAIGALISVLAQPFWGMVSDRMRSRFGKRSPLIVGGAVFGAAALIAMSLSSTLLMIAVAWCLVQLTVNAVQGPLTAVIADRVPVAVRGAISGLVGFAAMLGSLGGQILGSTLAPKGYLLAYGVVAGILLVSALLFVLLNREPSSIGEPLERFSLGTFLRTFWVDPIKHPDFAWTFWGRMLLVLGFFAVGGYQLYILQDYIGLGEAGALESVPILGVISLAAMLLSISVSGWLSDKLGRRKPFVFISSTICGLGLAVPFLLPTFEGMVLYNVLVGLGFGCYIAVDTALFTQVLPSQDDAAKDLGVANIANAGPQVVAPVIAGVIVVNMGGYQPLFIVALIFSVLGALCIIPIKSVK